VSRIVAFDSLQPFQAVNLLLDPGHVAGPVIIPNACRVRLNWNLADGKVGHNVMYAQYSGTPVLSPTVAESVRQAITTGATWTSFLALLHPNCSFAGVTLLDVRSSTATEITSTGAALPGTGAGTSVPDEVAICLTLRTANRGPSGRGRIYLMGFLASNINATGGTVAPGTVAAITAWGNGPLLAGIASSLGPVVLGLPARAGYTSPATGRVFPARAATTVPVTAALCRNNTWDSQRRRGLK
jgi:hypothetical protein